MKGQREGNRLDKRARRSQYSLGVGEGRREIRWAGNPPHSLRRVQQNHGSEVGGERKFLYRSWQSESLLTPGVSCIQTSSGN